MPLAIAKELTKITMYLLEPIIPDRPVEMWELAIIALVPIVIIIWLWRRELRLRNTKKKR